MLALQFTKYLQIYYFIHWKNAENKRKHHRQLSQISKIKPSLTGIEKQAFSTLQQGQEAIPIKKAYDWP